MEGKVTETLDTSATGWVGKGDLKGMCLYSILPAAVVLSVSVKIRNKKKKKTILPIWLCSCIPESVYGGDRGFLPRRIIIPTPTIHT